MKIQRKQVLVLSNKVTTKFTAMYTLLLLGAREQYIASFGGQG